ncbi:MAG: NAD(P)/FAD-dependent oxidoreductase [Pseudomonadota bacterium]
MSPIEVNTLIVGGGQAGIAMSVHLARAGIDHVVLEKNRIAEAWRTARWDSLVANGPAWHDRFPDKEFSDTDGAAFATKHSCARYFEEYVAENSLPLHTGIEVTKAAPSPDGGYLVETNAGTYQTRNIVAATGPFQVPVIPPIVPSEAPAKQIHSQSYRNPNQLADGAVLIVGAGSSGVQIADELRRAGRDVYLSVGPHERPPRRYRGEDYCHWLGVLGKWQMKTPPAGREHVTISVSGAHGGHTVDFRDLAQSGIRLVGMAKSYESGALLFEDDLAKNISDGDDNHLGLLDEVDAYVADHGLDNPPEENAKLIGPDPDCLANPTLRLNLQEAGIATIIWATGYRQDFSWLEVDTFNERGQPIHTEGVSPVPGIYFLGLPWLSMRGSSFIWGVYVDAERLAGEISRHTEPAVEAV